MYLELHLLCSSISKLFPFAQCYSIDEYYYSNSNTESNTMNTKSICGTQTEKNLLKAFAGESQARMRYTFFASVARKEGYEQVAAIFLETAEQEKEHAKRFFKFLEGGDLEITATYPAGKIGTTSENLLAAAMGLVT